VDFMLEEIPLSLDQALDGVQRVAKIVRAMKEFSHPGVEDKTAIDINHAIETTLTVARSEWKYVAEVETALDTTLPLVPCLASEFNQVLLNLLTNATHAIADKRGNDGPMGKIRIKTLRENEWVRIQIEDSGCGVPEYVRSRIFEPFFTTKEVGRGTGQGLALAHTIIVKKHSGQIWFDSEEGVGTTFFLRLPIAS
jgi:signal transduction histidine kinase